MVFLILRQMFFKDVTDTKLTNKVLIGIIHI